MSQREAYRNAFPSAVKWKDATVDSKASELFGNDEILERYNELQREFADRALYTREEAVTDLRWMQREERTTSKKTASTRQTRQPSSARPSSLPTFAD